MPNKVEVHPPVIVPVEHDPKPGDLFFHRGDKEFYIWTAEDWLVCLNDGNSWERDCGFDGDDAEFERVTSAVTITPEAQ